MGLHVALWFVSHGLWHFLQYFDETSLSSSSSSSSTTKSSYRYETEQHRWNKPYLWNYFFPLLSIAIGVCCGKRVDVVGVWLVGIDDRPVDWRSSSFCVVDFCCYVMQNNNNNQNNNIQDFGEHASRRFFLTPTICWKAYVDCWNRETNSVIVWTLTQPSWKHKVVDKNFRWCRWCGDRKSKYNVRQMAVLLFVLQCLMEHCPTHSLQNYLELIRDAGFAYSKQTVCRIFQKWDGPGKWSSTSKVWNTRQRIPVGRYIILSWCQILFDCTVSTEWNF